MGSCCQPGPPGLASDPQGHCEAKPKQARFSVLLAALLFSSTLALTSATPVQASDTDYALKGVAGSVQPDLFTGSMRKKK